MLSFPISEELSEARRSPIVVCRLLLGHEPLGGVVSPHKQRNAQARRRRQEAPWCDDRFGDVHLYRQYHINSLLTGGREA